MSARPQVALLRAALPPLSTLSADSTLACAWLDRHGHLLEQGERRLGELGAAVQGKALEIGLHPHDSLLACIELPPLPAARLVEAVTLAADTLLLGGDQAVHLVHGPRNADGQVQLAWLERAAVQQLLQLLRQHGLQPRGVYAAPYFLALAEPGTCSATLLDGHLLVRQDNQRAWVHALPAEGGVQLRDQRVHWLGPQPAPCATAAELPAEQRWNGPVPACNLLQGLQQAARGNARWGRAIACCAMAALVWTLGLNLHAMRLADEGQALKARMVSRVQQVFPELPVILNPLQQARQQRDARQAGSAAGAPVTFATLVHQASAHLPFMTGAVERLDFDGQQLHLTSRAPARKPPADTAWQTALAEVGLEASLAAGQWTLRPLSTAAATTGANREASDE